MRILSCSSLSGFKIASFLSRLLAWSCAMGLPLSAMAQPAIVVNPAIGGTEAYAVGVNLTMTAVYPGVTPLSYSWKRNGVKFAEGSTVSIPNAQVSDAGVYELTAQVTSNSSVGGSGALVSIRGASPADGDRLWLSPASLTLGPGDSTVLSVSFHPILSTIIPSIIKWYKNGALILSATGTSYVIGGAAAEGTYTVELGAYRSNPAQITVNSTVAPPAFATLPESTWAPLGGGASFGFSYSHSGGATAQWYRNGVPITGATLPSYSIANVTAADYGDYTVVITNSGGAATSSVASLFPRTPPTITQQPVAQTVAIGGTLVLSVAATGSSEVLPLSYQWRKDFTNIAGATGSSYTKTNAQSSDAGYYDVTVFGQRGYESSFRVPVTVGNTSPIPGAISILGQPAAQSVNAGTAVQLSVGVSGSEPIGYQWYKNGVLISGANAVALNLPNAQVSDSGLYTVLVSNAVSSVTSSGAQVTVTPPAAGTPIITVPPASQTAAAGSTVTFSITATGATPFLSYAWFRNGQLQPGSLPTFMLTNVSAVDAGEYYVRVADMNGVSVNSQTFTLTVLAATGAPVILTQPSAQTRPTGSSVTFLVSANGTPAPSYQWYKHGLGALPGATGSSLTLGTLSTSDAGDFYVVVSNSAGSVTSAGAKLTVVASDIAVAPVILQQPLAQNVVAGNDATFTVTASGSPAPTYQWFFNGARIDGATSASFSRRPATLVDSGSYHVTIANSAGSVTSTAVLLSVLAAEDQLAITTQPVSRTVGVGANVVFTVGVRGPAARNYQWFRDGVPIAGATQSSLTLTNVQSTQAGSYSVTISSRLTAAQQVVTSSTATLAVTQDALVAIVTQPVNQTALAGAAANFSVTASGTGPISFQWFRNGSTIPGAHAASFTIPVTQLADTGNYSVAVSNAGGSVLSSTATLTIHATRFTGTYFGQLGTNPSDRFAIVIRPDGTALFMGYASSQAVGYTANAFTVNVDGSFSADLIEIKSAVVGAMSTDGRTKQAAAFTPVLNGSVVGESLSGVVTGASLELNAPKSPAAGAAQASAGIYQTAPINSTAGQLTTIVDATGRAFVFVQTSTGAAAGTGTFDSASGSVALTLTDSTKVTTTVDPAKGSAAATVTTPSNETLAFSGLAEGKLRTDRLVNISSRAAVATGDLIIAGFVITGTQSKSVMIRATGPALTTLGLSGAMPNPKLQLFSGQAKIMENDNWSSAGNADEVVSTAKRTGAFGLAGGSRDAVILATLAPGSYTAQVSAADGAPGIALVEVYDAGEGAIVDSTPRIINISTRATVAGGEGLLIAGIVISGNTPKQVLIRGTGPALAELGVSNTLSDPRIKLFKGDTLLRENDNWSESPADATAIAAAAAATGAFALTPGSRDAALLLNLEPGSYTVLVAGADNSTGASLVEVYEVNR